MADIESSFIFHRTPAVPLGTTSTVRRDVDQLKDYLLSQDLYHPERGDEILVSTRTGDIIVNLMTTLNYPEDLRLKLCLHPHYPVSYNGERS